MSELRTPLTVAYEAAAAPATDLGVAVAAHYGDPAGEERAFTDGAALVDRCARGAVLVEGPDALKFLQEYMFSDKAFQFPPELLRRLAVERWYHWGARPSSTDFPLHDRVLEIQGEGRWQVQPARGRAAVDGPQAQRLVPEATSGRS